MTIRNTFQIGEAFRAEEPSARIATVLAMISNDTNRIVALLDQVKGETDEAHALRMMFFRYGAASYFEAVDWLQNAKRDWPDEFESLLKYSDEARERLDRVLSSSKRSPLHALASWLKDHRNVMFHYPIVNEGRATSGREEITGALQRASRHTGEIVYGENFGDTRYPFADQVARYLLPGEDEPSRRDIRALADFTTDLVFVAQALVSAYVAVLPDRVAGPSHQRPVIIAMDRGPAAPLGE
ncbi:MAG TPA: hypothetical protein VGM91_05615 [Conexibacter sp.]|jgi:hypothetical protein